MWGGRFLQRVCTELFPIVTVGVDEVGDLLKSSECNGLLEGGVWGVGVEFITVDAIIANKVGDCTESLK